MNPLGDERVKYLRKLSPESFRKLFLNYILKLSKDKNPKRESQMMP
jgi:hypothetical protein